jgi:hypothetical protein
MHYSPRYLTTEATVAILVLRALGSKEQLEWKNVAILLTFKCVFERVQQSDGIPVDL